MARRTIPRARRWSQLLEAEAFCQTCHWRVEGPNAVAIAAQHSGRLNHPVMTTQTIAVNFEGAE